MSMFRDPYYLDVQKLIPFANHHDVEVAGDVSVTVRDLGTRRGSGGFNVGMPGLSVELGGEHGSESEVTQSRSTKGHPVSALNTLIDKLADDGDDGLLQDVPSSARKRQHLEVEREWAVSEATELGGLLSTLFRSFSSNPASMQSNEMSPEIMSAIMDPDSVQKEGLVLQSVERDSQDRSVILLLDAGNLLPSFDLQDLESDLTVFGQIDSVVPEGEHFSLEKFLLSGVSRQVRRMFKVEDVLKAFASMPGVSTDPESLKVHGPAVVIRPIAIY